MANIRSLITLGLALVVAATLAAGCRTTRSPVNATVGGGPPATSGKEIPGSGGAIDITSATAGAWIDDMRIGHAVDAAGNVPPERTSDDFRLGDPVYVSMSVADAPAGTAVRLSLFDEKTERPVWTEEKRVSAGEPYLWFQVDTDKLHRAKYRAVVTVGDETIKSEDFEILG